MQLERHFDGGKINRNATQLDLFGGGRKTEDTEWRNLIVQGDNLQFLKTCWREQGRLEMLGKGRDAKWRRKG